MDLVYRVVQNRIAPFKPLVTITTGLHCRAACDIYIYYDVIINHYYAIIVIRYNAILLFVRNQCQ